MDVGQIVGMIGVIVAIALYLRTLRPRHEFGKITLKNGHEYSYVVGDDIRWYQYTGQMRGIQVELPKNFPHIYLDSKVGGGIQARFTIASSQRIQLEGNFNDYFQAYVPKGHAADALSILAPDVMQVIISVAGAYDLELYGSHLRVIASRSVYKNPQAQAQLVAIVTKVLEQIDQKLVGWTDASSEAALDEDLTIYPEHGVRIAGRYVPVQFIVWETLWLFMLAIFSAVAVLAWDAEPNHASALLIIGLGVGLFIAMTIIAIVLTRRGGFRAGH